MIWAAIKTTFEGFHCWPDAPDTESYLRNPHRHIFYVYLHIQQFADDRDIEYHALKKWLDGIIRKNVLPLHTKSCEQIAITIKGAAEIDFPSRYVKVSVFEDDENGAIVG